MEAKVIKVLVDQKLLIPSLLLVLQSFIAVYHGLYVDALRCMAVYGWVLRAF